MSASYLSSPDQPSRVYPDRLIRPLPKRTLRSRLSQEAAESITFPPNPPSSNLPSYGQYSQNGEFLSDNKVHVHQNTNIYDPDDPDDEDQCPHHHQHCDHDVDDDDVESVDDASLVAVRHSNSYRTSPRSSRSRHNRYGSYSAKAASSAPDGYEAFENTNNKKKRKIPTSGSLSLHQSSLTNDLASMGISGTKDGAGDDPSYYGSPSPSSGGVQGVGRTRGGRKSTGRNPLGISVNGSNARTGAGPNMAADVASEDSKPDQGIISAAIANATALLRNPLGKGQENVGVLDQQAKAPPTNSQFTFTCETEAKGVKFPEQSLYSPDYTQRTSSSLQMPQLGPSQRFSNHGTQTSPGVPTLHSQQMPAPQQPLPADAQGKKSRRRKGDVYALAARQRKLQQEYINLQHSPASEDIWICEFCEYESIFGAPPRALIRQYEIKDRRERKRLAEKQRLLEKAKLKGRKGKKQTKNAAKAANHTSQQPANQQTYDQPPLDPMGEDYLDDGYDDDPAPMPAPPQTTAKQQTTMPGSYNANANVDKAGGGIDRGGIR